MDAVLMGTGAPSLELSEFMEKLAEAANLLGTAINTLSEALSRIFGTTLPDLFEMLETVVDELPVKKPLPRPPKKLGPKPHNAYTLKIRATARSLC